MYVLVVCTVILLLMLTLGVIEKRSNDKNVEKLKLRINVNGIRGKSTATRLITAILWEAGYHAIGKTTGTAARMFYWDKEEEKEIKRPPAGVNISEQIRVIREAVSYGADSLVCECMAIRPEYQRVYQHQIINANLTVITNVLEDHLEEMGPTTEQIAWAFAETIPYHGIAVIPDCEFIDLFKQTAQERKTKVYVIDDSKISDDYLAKFDYKLFAHNCAVALTVAEALNISDDVAFRGMLKAPPDPGALRSYQLEDENGPFVLVNAFAANEPSSSLEIWDMYQDENPEQVEDPIILINCRADRVDRTRQFARKFIRRIPNAILIAVGEGTKEISSAYRRGRFPNILEYHNYDGMSADKVLENIKPLLANHTILCVGNIHGSCGGQLMDAIIRYGSPNEPEETVTVAEPKNSSLWFTNEQLERRRRSRRIRRKRRREKEKEK